MISTSSYIPPDVVRGTSADRYTWGEKVVERGVEGMEIQGPFCNDLHAEKDVIFLAVSQCRGSVMSLQGGRFIELAE